MGGFALTSETDSVRPWRRGAVFLHWVSHLISTTCSCCALPERSDLSTLPVGAFLMRHDD
jgi:hypothetical protein